MRKIKITCILLITIVQFGYVQVMDGVYLKSSGHTYKADSIIDFDPRIKYIFSELKDSVSLKKLEDKGDKYNLYLAKSPLKFKDFTFFNQNLANFQVKKDHLGTGDYNFFDLFFMRKYFNKKYEASIYPPSLRYYADTNSIKVNLSNGEITVMEKPILDKYIEPFYFKNYEVTNAEYREFVNWTKDSIAMELLINGGYAKKYCICTDKEDSLKHKLNWKAKIDWNSNDTIYSAVLRNLYLKDEERFYRRKEIDSRKINYTFYLTKEEKKEYGFYKEIINIYPDTLCWVHDFAFSFNEPMTDNYFWHPAYNNFPVVGLSYLQTLSYLHWKTKMMQQELDNEGIKYRVELKLPSEIEWEIVSSAVKKNNLKETYTQDSPYLWDDSWITDLELKFRSAGSDTIKVRTDISGNVVKNSSVGIEGLLLKDEKFFGNYFADNYFHTSEADIHLIDKKKINSELLLNLDPLGISYMGGNVSEWMDNTMDDSWKVLFMLRQKLLISSGFQEAKMVSSIENYYFQFNYNLAHSKYDKNYKPNNSRLVRGGNWYDERFSDKYGKNIAGMNAKYFAEGTDLFSSSTVGFRYIIKIYPK